MAWQKGQSGNPGGLNTRQARVRNMIEGLSIRAVERLETLIRSDNESVALGAIKEVLGRVAPAPKTGTLNVEVNHSSPHLAALVGMAQASLARVNGVSEIPESNAQVIDITPIHPKPLGSDTLNVDVASVDSERAERGND